MSEKCARCGHTGEDRRTLWMACFYAMHELPVPFEQIAIEGPIMDKIGEEPTEFGFSTPKWGKPEHPSRRSFYTLRVCKRCRGDWMAAIGAWFADKPADSDSDAEERDAKAPPPSHGVYVRKLGVTRLATDEEIEEMKRT